MGSPVKLEAIHCSVTYQNPRTGARTVALADVTLSIASGEFVSIVGPSGCGKTTFLNCLDGLLPITRGQILLDGTADHRARTRPLDGFPEPFLASLAHGVAQCHLRARTAPCPLARSHP